MPFRKHAELNEFSNISVSETHEPIDESIGSTENIFNKLLESNELESAYNAFEPHLNKSIYHNLMNAFCLMFTAGLTWDKPHIERAAKALDKLSKISYKHRKHGILISVMKMIKTPNYQKHTDLELHAELTFAYTYAMTAFVYLLDTQSIYGLIKVAYRLQRFFRLFKMCKVMLKTKRDWESEVSRKNFEAGVRLANGVSHLAISNVPPKILRIVNFLGFKGVEDIGFYHVNKAAFECDGVFSQLGRFFMLFYWTIFEPHCGLGPANISNCELVLQKELQKFPRGVIFQGFNAKKEQISGHLDKSIEIYNELLKTDLDSCRRVLHADIMASYALKCDWTESIKYAEQICEESAHRPAFTTYCQAVLYYAKYVDESDEKFKQKASELFRIVPALRIRQLGKTLTPEKVAVVSSEKYFMSNEFLILPEMELLYQINYLSTIKSNEKLLKKLMDRVEKQIDLFKDDIELSDYLDNYLTAMFFKGVILRIMDHLIEAKNCFYIVLQDEARIGREFSIPPQTVLELGLTELAQDNYEEAEKWLNKCIADYSGYLNENYVHLRAYAGFRAMGLNTDKQNANESKLEEYRKEWLKNINIEENKYETIVQKEELIATKQ